MAKRTKRRIGLGIIVVAAVLLVLLLLAPTILSAGPGAAIVFKGSGYYVTDYRSKSYDDAKKADTPNKSGAESGGSSKETKKAKKSDSSGD